MCFDLKKIEKWYENLLTASDIYIPINKAVKWGRWRGALIKIAVKLTFHTLMGWKNFYSLFINTMPVNIRGGEGWLEELQKTESGEEKGWEEKERIMGRT